MKASQCFWCNSCVLHNNDWESPAHSINSFVQSRVTMWTKGTQLLVSGPHSCRVPSNRVPGEHRWEERELVSMAIFTFPKVFPWVVGMGEKRPSAFEFSLEKNNEKRRCRQRKRFGKGKGRCCDECHPWAQGCSFPEPALCRGSQESPKAPAFVLWLWHFSWSKSS